MHRTLISHPVPFFFFGQLPSSRFRFVSWHRLEQCEVTGDQLTCPRVREGLDRHCCGLYTLIEIHAAIVEILDGICDENSLFSCTVTS